MKAKKPIEEPDREQIGRYLTKEISPTEINQVEAWADASEQNKRKLDQYKLLFQHADNFYQLKKFDTDKAWENVQKHTALPVSVIRVADIRNRAAAIYYKYAAVILIAIMAGSVGYFIYHKNSANSQLTEVVTLEAQVVNEYVLSDGSTVSLNSNSKLQFPETFDKGQREITITGEAFFDVKPDPQRPFIINAGSARVKVLGTSFNVAAYPEAESVEVIVESGIVQVACCENGRTEKTVELLLSAGEKGTLFSSNGQFEKSINTNPNYLAWKTHNLIFEKTHLKEVVNYLNNIYHIDIQLKNKELENLLLTAEFEQKPAEFILDVIRITFDLELEQQDNNYILSEKSTSNF